MYLTFRNKAGLYLSFLLIFSISFVKAQSITHEGEVWGGYMSSIGLNDNFALWNDFHYVANTFFVSRHGITYYFLSKFDVTAGYAYVTTNTSFSDNLIRPENRIWGQVVGRFMVTDKIRYQVRYRHDGRYRKQVVDQEVIDDRIFYHRLRLMNAFRFNLKTLKDGKKWHFDVMDEILFNAGGQISTGLDQNRLYILNGITGNNYTFLAGYHMRAIPTGQQNITLRHGLTFWMIHYLDFLR